MRALALVLLSGCATTHKVDRAADSITAVAASIQRVTDELAPLTPQQASEPPQRITSPLQAALAAAPVIAGDAIALWRAVASAWVQVKKLRHEGAAP